MTTGGADPHQQAETIRAKADALMMNADVPWMGTALRVRDLVDEALAVVASLTTTNEQHAWALSIAERSIDEANAARVKAETDRETAVRMSIGANDARMEANRRAHEVEGLLLAAEERCRALAGALEAARKHIDYFGHASTTKRLVLERIDTTLAAAGSTTAEPAATVVVNEQTMVNLREVARFLDCSVEEALEECVRDMALDGAAGSSAEPREGGQALQIAGWNGLFIGPVVWRFASGPSPLARWKNKLAVVPEGDKPQ